MLIAISFNINKFYFTILLLLLGFRTLNIFCSLINLLTSLTIGHSFVSSSGLAEIIIIFEPYEFNEFLLDFLFS